MVASQLGMSHESHMKSQENLDSWFQMEPFVWFHEKAEAPFIWAWFNGYPKFVLSLFLNRTWWFQKVLIFNHRIGMMILDDKHILQWGGSTVNLQKCLTGTGSWLCCDHDGRQCCWSPQHLKPMEVWTGDVGLVLKYFHHTFGPPSDYCSNQGYTIGWIASLNWWVIAM